MMYVVKGYYYILVHPWHQRADESHGNSPPR